MKHAAKIIGETGKLKGVPKNIMKRLINE